MQHRIILSIAQKSERDAIKIALEITGYAVVTTTDINQTLKYIADGNVVCILCDSKTASEENYAYIDKLKRNQSSYRLPITLLCDAETDANKWISKGISDVIVSPITGKAIAARIHAHVEHYLQQNNMYVTDINQRIFNLLNKNFNQELFTPINGIINTTQLISSMMSEEEKLDYEDLINVIHASTYRMWRVTHNMLMYAAIKSDSVQQHPKEINLSELVLKIINDYQTGLTPDTCTIAYSCSQTAHFNGSEELLKTIFIELIDNAVKFSAPNTQPKVYLEVNADAFSLRVSNIPNHDGLKHLEQIAPYKKFHKDISHNGLGMGLYVCYALCQELGYTMAINRHKNEIGISVTTA